MTTLLDDPWLAGFADGESHFGVYKQRPDTGFVPRFIVCLRADDLPILEALRAEIDGPLRRRPAPAHIANGRPGYEWRVNSKAGLIRLVEYFDRFPLRTKKARDYAIWRQAVMAYARSGMYARELPALAEALRAVRVYQEPTEGGTMDRIHVYTDAEGGHRWRRVAPNGEIVADSGEGYSSKEAAEDAAAREAAGGDAVVVDDD